jgi:hypothetical protein
MPFGTVRERLSSLLVRLSASLRSSHELLFYCSLLRGAHRQHTKHICCFRVLTTFTCRPQCYQPSEPCGTAGVGDALQALTNHHDMHSVLRQRQAIKNASTPAAGLSTLAPTPQHGLPDSSSQSPTTRRTNITHRRPPPPPPSQEAEPPLSKGASQIIGKTTLPSWGGPHSPPLLQALRPSDQHGLLPGCDPRTNPKGIPSV